MSAPPIPMMFDEEAGAFRVLPNFLRTAREHYGAGEVVPMVPREDRSAVSHRHFMASVGEAWKNLPESAGRFTSADHLRKFVLIQTGHRDETVYVCKFKTEANRLAATLTDVDEYAVIVVDGTLVTRWTAKSQSYFNMNRKEFQTAKRDVLEYLADMLGVPVGALAQQREAA